MNNQISKIGTLADLKNFINGLSEEQLKQPIEIGMEDAPAIFIKSATVLQEDHLYDGHDWDTYGSKSDVESWIENKDIAADMEDFVTVHPKGSVLFFTTYVEYPTDIA